MSRKEKVRGRGAGEAKGESRIVLVPTLRSQALWHWRTWTTAFKNQGAMQAQYTLYKRTTNYNTQKHRFITQKTTASFRRQLTVLLDYCKLNTHVQSTTKAKKNIVPSLIGRAVRKQKVYRQYVHLYYLCVIVQCVKCSWSLWLVDPTSRGEQEETARFALSSFLSSSFQQVFSPWLVIISKGCEFQNCWRRVAGNKSCLKFTLVLDNSHQL